MGKWQEDCSLKISVTTGKAYAGKTALAPYLLSGRRKKRSVSNGSKMKAKTSKLLE
jgi:hypothetical protein